MAVPETHVELRGPCPRDIVDVLDAISTARRMSRMQLVVEVLGRFTDEQRHISTVIHSVTGCNPRRAEG